MKQLHQQLKYQERDKIWLVGRLRVEKKICNKIRHKKWSPKHCQLQRKQTLSEAFYLQKVPFDFYPTDLVNTKTSVPLRGDIYLDAAPPPPRGIVVYYKALYMHWVNSVQFL